MLKTIFQKIFSSRNWLAWLALAAFGLLAAVWLFSPQQIPVILYKGVLVLFAMLIGTFCDAAICPYGRPSGYLVDDWWKKPDQDGGTDVDYPVVEGYAGVFAAAVIRRGIIVGAVILGVCLGL